MDGAHCWLIRMGWNNMGRGSIDVLQVVRWVGGYGLTQDMQEYDISAQLCDPNTV